MRAYISTGVNSWAEFSVNGEEVEVRDEYSEGEDSASVYDYLSISIYSEDTNEQLYQAEYSVFYGTRDEILSFFDGLDYDLDSLEEEDPEDAVVYQYFQSVEDDMKHLLFMPSSGDDLEACGISHGALTKMFGKFFI